MSESIEEITQKLRDAESAVRVAEARAQDATAGRTKLAVWSAIGGLMLVVVGGQWFPGYQLDSTAKANEMRVANSATMDVIAQLCMARFMTEPGVDDRLAALEKENGDWSKAAYIRKGDWAQAPDGESPDHTTADKCRALIAENVKAEPRQSS